MNLIPITSNVKNPKNLNSTKAGNARRKLIMSTTARFYIFWLDIIKIEIQFHRTSLLSFV
jgi:hypothetical protein